MKISYREAINQALVLEMERDPAVFIYGLDVTDHKGIFGSTRGLLERFGPQRCFITPLSEDAMSGMGLGAAISGLRPVHVHQRVDFMLLCMNQIANMLSSCHYISGGRLKVPMVFRAIIGRGWGQSCQHSKSMHSTFSHIPGIKVVMPTTPQDAIELLPAAIRDDNPVVVLEHRWLYDIVGDISPASEINPLGKGRTVRAGRDLTIVAVSWMNVEALKAADILARHHGIEVEIIDPRTIQPLDEDLILNSINKTGRCLVADYDWTFCGFSAEVCALAMEKAFAALKAPVARIGFAPTPCPTTRPLEDAFYPGARSIIRKIEEMLALPAADLSEEQFFSYENKFKGPF
ncbi:Acetoin dehydrogenase E1 component beta-subunit (EC [Olavius algarvensis Delta 1 endosymbiont]|nr:Acetoin dehydrogenase E1 component beta-subunit (EC [Olavius algarvensis Delta 1 endosymbiont]